MRGPYCCGLGEVAHSLVEMRQCLPDTDDYPADDICVTSHGLNFITHTTAPYRLRDVFDMVAPCGRDAEKEIIFWICGGLHE